MKDVSSDYFYGKLHNKNQHFPLNGQIELTYRCSLNCVHCYCKGSEDRNKELTAQEWRRILDEIHKEGCIWLTFTGGDPLIRDDFLEIYSYVKEKGFIITLFTNGLAFTDEIIDYLAKSPPFSIEITLNGITETTYEIVTQVKGSYLKVMDAIKKIAEKKLPLILKANCLKQNKHEIVKIKKWTEEFLGKPSEDKYYFKFDTMIYARLNGDKTPANFRLSFEEILEVKKQDPDIWDEYQRGLHQDFPDLKRDKTFLYRCNSWMTQFFIDPYGILKFCQFSDKYSSDLRRESFRDGFYHKFPQLLKEKFKINSKCKDCSLRPVCYHCPARAFLETGDEEAPVEYFCQLAKATAEEMGVKALK